MLALSQRCIICCCCLLQLQQATVVSIGKTITASVLLQQTELACASFLPLRDQGNEEHTEQRSVFFLLAHQQKTQTNKTKQKRRKFSNSFFLCSRYELHCSILQRKSSHSLLSNTMLQEECQYCSNFLRERQPQILLAQTQDQV